MQTTLDADLQEAANRAIDRGLRRLDKRHSGYRKPARNILTERRAPDTFTTDRWNRPILEGDIVPALVLSVGPKGGNGSARVRIGAHDVELPKSAFAWTRKTAALDLVTLD